MPINDIMAEQRQTGELDSEFEQFVSASNQSQRQGSPTNQTAEQPQQPQQMTRRPPRRSLLASVGAGQYSREDIQFALDIGIFVMLVLIWSRM